MATSARWITAGAGLSLGIASGLAVRRSRTRRKPLETYPFVDLERYQGRWFEIARYPMPFERACAKNVTANYTVRGNGVRVVNACTDGDGQVRVTEGSARVADRETNAKLVVRFGPFARGQYWILDVGDDYSYAVVGEPKRRFLWILSRTPALDEHTFGAICERLALFGYDPGKLQRTLQD